MRFGLDDTAEMIQGEVRSLVRGRLAAEAMRWNEGHGSAADALPTLAEMGLLGVLADERAGGAGLDAATFAVVLDALAGADAGLGALVAVHNLALAAALDAGLGDAVTGAAAGAPRLCWVDGRGSGHLDDDAAAFTLADGALKGAAAAVVGLDGADLAVVVADEGGVATLAVVALGTEGVERGADGLVGLRTAGCATLRCAGARVRASARAPALGAARTRARLAMAALLCGAGRAGMEAGVRYSLERTQFGRPIGGFQPLQWQTADSTTELEAARLLLGRACWAFDTGAVDAADRADRAAAAAFEAARAASDRAVQMHGGYGYTTDYAVERPYRDVYALPLVGGSAIAARARVAARLAAR